MTSAFSGLCSSSVTAGRPLSCGFDSSLVEHCTGNAEVVGSNPAQSLNLFRSLDSSLVEHCTGNAEVVGSNPA